MNDEDKVHIIKDLELDYYFDDKPAVLETLRDQPLKLYAKTQSYNKHLDISRIEHWTELNDILECTKCN